MLPEKASKRGGSRKGKGKKQSKCEISGQAPVLAWSCRELRSTDYTLQPVSPPGKGGGLPYAHAPILGVEGVETQTSRYSLLSEYAGKATLLHQGQDSEDSHRCESLEKKHIEVEQWAQKSTEY